MGLAIVAGIIRLLKGTIHISSEVNVGTTVTGENTYQVGRYAALQQLRYLLQLPEMSSAFLACLLLMIMKWPVRLFPVCLLMLDTLSRLQPRLNETTGKASA